MVRVQNVETHKLIRRWCGINLFSIISHGSLKFCPGGIILLFTIDRIVLQVDFYVNLCDAQVAVNQSNGDANPVFLADFGA